MADHAKYGMPVRAAHAPAAAPRSFVFCTLRAGSHEPRRSATARTASSRFATWSRSTMRPVCGGASRNHGGPSTIPQAFVIRAPRCALRSSSPSPPRKTRIGFARANLSFAGGSGGSVSSTCRSKSPSEDVGRRPTRMRYPAPRTVLNETSAPRRTAPRHTVELLDARTCDPVKTHTEPPASSGLQGGPATATFSICSHLDPAPDRRGYVSRTATPADRAAPPLRRRASRGSRRGVPGRRPPRRGSSFVGGAAGAGGASPSASSRANRSAQQPRPARTACSRDKHAEHLPSGACGQTPARRPQWTSDSHLPAPCRE